MTRSLTFELFYLSFAFGVFLFTWMCDVWRNLCLWVCCICMSVCTCMEYYGHKFTHGQ